MTGRWEGEDDERSGGRPDNARAGRDSSAHDGFWGPERSGLARGVLLVVVGIVICVVLLPSATRAPLSIAASRTGTSTTLSPSSPTSTTIPSHSSTTTTTTPAAATVHVLVANATNVNGVAGAVTTYLGSKGYPTLTATNALTKLSSSQIYFTSHGSSAEASQVASALTLSASAVEPASAMPPVASTSGAAVVVVVGQDLAARFAPASTTTTTKG